MLYRYTFLRIYQIFKWKFPFLVNFIYLFPFINLDEACWPYSTNFELKLYTVPNSEQIAHDVALLLAVQLGHVLVRPHSFSEKKYRNILFTKNELGGS